MGPEALRVAPRVPMPPPTGAPAATVKGVPPLVRGYLTLGAWVYAQTNIPGPPAINQLMSLWRTNPLDRAYYRIEAELP